MGKSLPPLTWFRAFEAAARHLSFTAAAAEVGLTQSAISQQVKALETRLGVALFARHPRGLALTDDGRRLLPQVGAALERLRAASEMFDAGPVENRLTVAASVSVTQWVISPHLAGFTARHPAVRLRLLSAIWPDDFVSARADVEIRFGSEKQVGRGAELLKPNRLVAVKAPGGTATLDALPLIETVGTSAGWRAWGESFGGTPVPRLFADSYGMALQLAVDGHGVALVCELLVHEALRTGALARVDGRALDAQEGYYLWADPANPAATAFRAWLLERIAG